MKDDVWKSIKYFGPKEKWGDPSKMSADLVFELDRLRKYIGRPIIIHCGYEQRLTGGFHPLGLAVDCHASGLHPMEFYIAATRFDFTGIGVYLWWNNPGLHLDKRPIKPGGQRHVWGSVQPQKYVPLDLDFIRQAMQLQRGT